MSKLSKVKASSDTPTNVPPASSHVFAKLPMHATTRCGSFTRDFVVHVVGKRVAFRRCSLLFGNGLRVRRDVGSRAASAGESHRRCRMQEQAPCPPL